MRRSVLTCLALLLVACGGGSRQSAFMDNRGETATGEAPAKGAAKRAAKAAPAKRAAPLPEKLGQLPLAARAVPILGGRLQVRLPEVASEATMPDEGPGASAATGDLARQTRHRIVLADQSALLLAIELFAREGPDLMSEVREEVEHWGQRAAHFDIQLVPNPNLSVVRVVPDEPLSLGLRDGPYDLALVAVLFVASSDGTVMSLALHANAAAVRDARGLSSLVSRIGGSIRPGRVFDTAGGTRVFTLFRRGPEVRMDLPDKTIAFEEERPDAETYVVQLTRPLGGTAAGSMRLTVGGRFDALPARGGRRVAGQFLGGAVQWLAETAEDGGRTLRLVHLAAEQPVEAVLTAPTAEALEALRTVAESVRFSQACEGRASCPVPERCEHEYCRSRPRGRD